ncbi:MAG: metallophosphoesterase [Ruminococcaceae bacterium]|nr:metallophosphoesterase [Oscillospiraceae bacterium]
MKTRKILLPIIIVLAVVFALELYLAWENKTIVTTKIEVVSEKIPESFSGYKIVHISDLHNTEFGFRNRRLIRKIREADPDIIVMTGDMVDMYRPHISVAVRLGEELSEIAPTYFVTGNHDVKAVGREELLAGFEKCGVETLKNKKVILEKDGEKISLMGIDDPKFLDDTMSGNDRENTEKALKKLAEKSGESFKILLAHRPEMIDIYSALEIDLVLSGHAHGGQINIPGKGGIIAPGQGWFPEFYEGLYEVGETQMIVNRGLGNSAFPFRINNKPEIIIAELKSK